MADEKKPETLKVEVLRPFRVNEGGKMKTVKPPAEKDGRPTIVELPAGRAGAVVNAGKAKLVDEKKGRGNGRSGPPENATGRAPENTTRPRSRPRGG